MGKTDLSVDKEVQNNACRNGVRVDVTKDAVKLEVSKHKVILDICSKDAKGLKTYNIITVFLFGLIL